MSSGNGLSNPRFLVPEPCDEQSHKVMQKSHKLSLIRLPSPKQDSVADSSLCLPYSEPLLALFALDGYALRFDGTAINARLMHMALHVILTGPTSIKPSSLQRTPSAWPYWDSLLPIVLDSCVPPFIHIPVLGHMEDPHQNATMLPCQAWDGSGTPADPKLPLILAPTRQGRILCS